MNTSIIYRKIFKSMGLTLFFGYLIFFLLYIIPAQRGDYLTVALVWMSLSYTFMYVGLLILFLRVVRIIKKNGHLLYISLGITNIFSGLLAVALYYFTKMENWWLYHCLINLVIGLIILADTIIKTEKERKNSQ
jgi:hypothetical protein